MITLMRYITHILKIHSMWCWCLNWIKRQLETKTFTIASVGEIYSLRNRCCFGWPVYGGENFCHLKAVDPLWSFSYQQVSGLSNHTYWFRKINYSSVRISIHPAEGCPLIPTSVRIVWHYTCIRTTANILHWLYRKYSTNTLLHINLILKFISLGESSHLSFLWIEIGQHQWIYGIIYVCEWGQKLSCIWRIYMLIQLG